MTCGVYLIRNLVSGRRYVGSSQNVEKRWGVHRSMLSSGRHHSQALQRAWAKRGPDCFSFELLEECPEPSLVEREQSWIDKLRPAYNSCPAAGTTRGTKRSPETIERIRQSAIRRASCPEERERRAARAKAQHAAGNLGAKTWSTGPSYNPASAVAGAEALKRHIKQQPPEEMARRARMRKTIVNRGVTE